MATVTNPARGTLLVTGGAGFIGANFILEWLAAGTSPVVNLDKLTYAGNLENLASVADHPQLSFVRGDIGDQALVSRLIATHGVTAIVNFAAETHVDRSIAGPASFIETNVVGTLALLEAARSHFAGLGRDAREQFRFLHVSTDEVYGSLGPHDAPFSEDHRFEPNSPYAASKAAADHLVRAYHQTYGLPTLTTHCSNNYGPFQFPEKLIPLMILNALRGLPLPLYGDGLNVRDWLYVADHARAIATVLATGQPGRSYNIGGDCERTNHEIVMGLCQRLDALRPRGDGQSYATQIVHVADRPGHDRRYAIDASRVQRELGWRPRETFESGMEKTVAWYLEHPEWVTGVTSGAYRDWISRHYGERQAP